MKKHSLSQKVTLKIGTIAVISQYGLASVFAAFKNKYNNININIFEDENEQVLNMLKSSQIDCAIVRYMNLDREKFDITNIADDQLVVVTSINALYSLNLLYQKYNTST
ncbi:LysR family transcriptional regulator substrate-binding protein [uncultured Clostridium sp.]|uniref:LysR family transcriptional regulator substrate-binding protein n=1 Tax=uncultured Clostridium sp. TaxID=59620 RepID=UPI002600359F|nr:LysR family transcriptional regulator substrate-binding protein [uncultured Clostridium sp.]